MIRDTLSGSRPAGAHGSTGRTAQSVLVCVWLCVCVRVWVFIFNLIYFFGGGVVGKFFLSF